MIHKALLAAAAIIPCSAFAQNVPAIQPGATASASASASAGQPQIVNGQQASSKPTPPPGWPSAPVLMAPSPKLDAKERASSALGTKWRNKWDKPHLDGNGVVRFIYGTSQARVVCAPLQMCDIQLEPGEVINSKMLGDTTYWHAWYNLTNSPKGMVSHITVQPSDAGRTTTLLIYTDRDRTYSIKLISDRYTYTALTGFDYPDSQEDQDASWRNYKLASSGNGVAGPSRGGVDASRIEPMIIEGDRPSWRPRFAYTDGRKTYIEFPAEMQFGDSPSLLGVNNDGGIFSSPSTRRVIYRWEGNRMVADSVLDKFELVQGVGSSAQKVIIERQH